MRGQLSLTLSACDNVTDSVSDMHVWMAHMWMAILRRALSCNLKWEGCARSLPRTLQCLRKDYISHISKQACLSADSRRALIQRCMQGCAQERSARTVCARWIALHAAARRFIHARYWLSEAAECKVYLCAVSVSARNMVRFQDSIS